MSEAKDKVYINATSTVKNPVGIGVYTKELTAELIRSATDQHIDCMAYTSSNDLKSSFNENVSLVSRYTSPSLNYRGYVLRLLWLQFIMAYYSLREKPKVIYSTVPEGMLFPIVKQIITVHDLLPLRYPELYPRMRYHFSCILPILLRKSKAIICISEYTKNEVIAHFGIRDLPIHVIYAGFNKTRFYKRKKGFVLQRYGITNKYLLFVGDMRPYKNLDRTLDAFSRLKDTTIQFVIGGKKDSRFYPAVARKVQELHLEDRVVFLDYVHEDDLPHLYSEAQLFIFPSLYEGFGLPPLEAMACGCPVIVSRAASLPEVCGNAAYYIDPLSVESIAFGISTVLEDETIQQALISKGLEQSDLFSWEKSAQKHLKLFKSVGQADSSPSHN
jgi:glycosyltransferase involved in cell wall biosynthesis